MCPGTEEHIYFELRLLILSHYNTFVAGTFFTHSLIHSFTHKLNNYSLKVNYMLGTIVSDWTEAKADSRRVFTE